MARPARPWFRFYVETLSDRKLRRIPPAQRWVWAAVMAAARQSPRPGLLLVAENEPPMDEHDLADLAAVPVKDVQRALTAFERSDMIARDDETGAWRVVNWGKRQFESDIRAGDKGERNHRNSVDGTTTEPTTKPPPNQQRNHAGSGDETAPEPATELARTRTGASHALMTETETETETEPLSSSGPSPGAPPAPDDDEDPHPPPDQHIDRDTHARIETALAILARSDLDKRLDQVQLEPLHDPGAWERQALARRRNQHADQLAAKARQFPNLSCELLAASVDQPPPGPDPWNKPPDPGRRVLPSEEDTARRLEDLRDYELPPPERVGEIARSARRALEQPRAEPEADQ